MTILFIFFLLWSHRCCSPLSHSPFRSSSYSRHPTGPHLIGPVRFVSPCPGPHLIGPVRFVSPCCFPNSLFSAIWADTPLSDLNLCHFVSYVHQRQLSQSLSVSILPPFTTSRLLLAAMTHCFPGCSVQSGLCDSSPQPVLASPATYHSGQSAVAAQEVVPNPGVISESFVVGCLLF